LHRINNVEDLMILTASTFSLPAAFLGIFLLKEKLLGSAFQTCAAVNAKLRLNIDEQKMLVTKMYVYLKLIYRFSQA